jgi:phage gp29-like protein
VYPWWWAKKTYYKQALIYGDKFASPIPEFNVDKKLSQDEKDMLEKAGKEFHQASSFITPRGVETTLHQSNGTGGVFYINAINQLCNAEIARSILAQTLATNESSKTGTFAQAQVHQNTLGEVVGELRGDAEKTIVQEQMIRRLVDINFGPQSVYPKFTLKPFSAGELKELADAINVLCNITDENDNRLVDIKEDWVRWRANLPQRDLEKFPWRTEPLPIPVDPNKVAPQAKPTDGAA